MSPTHPGSEARRAAGRLCFVDFTGPAPSAALERRIEDDHIAGVVVFQKNVENPAQVAGLTTALQSIAQRSRGSPLWVSIDHEGGAVTKFAPWSSEAHGPRATPVPSAMAIGATGDLDLAREAGRITGRELRAMGIALNFAPVLDVNSNPANPIIGARAFGEDASFVDAMGSAYLTGLQDTGVAATAKHFPGHGDVSVDSHVGLPRIDHDLDRLKAVELVPFAGAVRAGVAAIMTAHIVHPAVDPSGAPATMSEPMLTGLLRNQLGFHGLICTDSMGMRAIVDHFGVGDAAVDAIRAGADVILALGPEAQQDEMLDHLARAIETGVLSGERLAEAFARIDSARTRWVGADGRSPAHRNASALDVADVVGSAQHLDVARRIAAAAITRVRDRAGALPLRGAIGVVSAGGPSADGAGTVLAAALKRQGANVRVCTVREDLSGLDRIVAVTSSRGISGEEQRATVLELHRWAPDRLVVVAAGDPYDLMAFPEISAYVVTYGADEPTVDAASQVLLGHIPARGRLPVSLPGLHPVGTG